MGSSRDSAPWLLWLALVPMATACSVGNGEGQITAQVWAPECGLEGEQMELDLDFFAADPHEELLEVRVQTSSNFVDRTNGVQVTVRDANAVKEQLGEPLDLGAPERERLADVGLFLNDECPVDFDRPPVNYVSRSGTITFDAIYAPQVDKDEVEIAATLQDVRVDDDFDPNERFATLDGEFRFLFNRGRPAQRFP